MIAVSAHAQGSILPVRAQPGARKDALAGEHDGSLRVAVTAAPERGKANAAIIGLLAEVLGLRPSRISLISGESTRIKKFLVVGIAPADLQAKIVEAQSD